MTVAEKVCTKCHQTLPITEFRRRNTGKGTYDSHCRICKSEEQKIYWQQNAHRWREGNRQRQHAKRLRLRAFMDAYLSDKKCIECGITDPLVLQFDHVRGIKYKDVSRLVKHACASEDVILAEIAKCDIVCANCHQRRTTLRSRGVLGNPTTPIS